MMPMLSMTVFIAGSAVFIPDFLSCFVSSK